MRSFLRWTQEDVVLSGVTIPKGDAVLTSYPSANRDEDVFEDPNRFDITRDDADKLLSFGLGMHYCLGAQVARREVRTLLGKFLDATTSVELACPVECRHGTHWPSPSTSRAPWPMRVMIRIDTATYAESVSWTPMWAIGEPSGPIENGTTYIVRPRIAPSNRPSSSARIS